jgi:hypothetical protein
LFVASKEEDLIIEMDEEDFDEAAVQTYEDFERQLQQLAKITANDATALDQAKQVFDGMYNARLWPDTHIYNSLLEVYAYHKNDSRSSNSVAEEAEQIVERMQDHVNTGAAKPDLVTYEQLMDVWIQQERRLNKVQAIIDRLLLSAEEDPNLQPNTEIYNKLIKAYGKIEGDAEQAEAILEQMIDDYKDGQDHKRPNQKSWVHVLRAYASRKYFESLTAKQQQQRKEEVTDDDNSSDDLSTVVEQVVEKIQTIMGRMERGYRVDGQEDWAPSVNAFNSLLQVYSQASRLSAGTEGAPGMYAREAEAVLYSMMERDDDDEVKRNEVSVPLRPNTESFNHVIQAYSNIPVQRRRQGRPRGSTGGDDLLAGVAFKVERLLQLQQAVESTPTPRTYVAAITAMSHDSRDPQKAVRAKRVLDKWLQQDEKDNNDNSSSPYLYSQAYKSILTACAYTHPTAGPEDKLAAFQIALDTLQEIQDKSSKTNNAVITADSRVYGLFVRACGNLLSNERKRDAVLETIFGQCCRDGYANDYVMRELERAASDELLLKLLGGFLEDGVTIPESWSRSAVQRP